MKQDSPASLRRKIGSAGDLQSVVRAMKAQAAASVGQYERSVAALGDYARSVELGLGVCFRMEALHLVPVTPAPKAAVGVRAIVFGSDQGLVGRFNDLVVDHARASLARMPAPAQVWAVGERVHASLLDTDMPLLGVFAVPDSVQAIAALVDEILLTVLEESFGTERRETAAEVHLFYNRPGAGSTFAPVGQRLLPLDDEWRRRLAQQPWPTAMLAETLGDPTATLRALIREYLFVSLFRACAESLASENASRLAAMDRADRNIDEMLGTLGDALHRLRQARIDEELSDVISGFKALRDQVDT
ncbi:F0F1 ATP synthase subunit gamma [Variovorax sp. H27-G14]|uniref:F0F1 ATP synthase subunit gamma n=1 Tax=Variovorax sp. H27-G14 TaxID=3111914 RepID=UPI0038FC51FA